MLRSSPVTTPLADDPHTVTATQTDATGNVSPPADPVTFTVDTAELAAPVITSPTDGQVINDPTPTVTGTGEPGATVEVSVDDTPAGTTAVDSEGVWNVDLTDPLDEGEHTITATQTEGGEVSPPSDPVTVTVDTVAPEPPVITDPTEDDRIKDPEPDISGTGEPGATVEVTIDGAVVGTAEVGDDGSWSLTVQNMLDCGRHTVTATQTDAAGNTSEPSSEREFQADLRLQGSPTEGSPTEGSPTEGSPTEGSPADR